MAYEPCPSPRYISGIGVHAGQPPARMAVVRSAIDEVHALRRAGACRLGGAT